MDDSGAWFPEAHSVLSSSGGQEVVDLLVDFLEREMGRKTLIILEAEPGLVAMKHSVSVHIHLVFKLHFTM